MSTMQLASNLLSAFISLLWVIFLFWILRRFKREISLLFETLSKRTSKITAGPFALEMSPQEQNVAVEGLLKAIERALRSESLEEQSRAAEEDLPKLKKTLSLTHEVTVGIESEAIRKLRLICDKVKDPNKWIDDYIFVSGTYGYNVWATEMAVMVRRGWIEVSGGKVRITEEGRRFAQSS